ncbi:MAG TPA: hypothetical protein VJU60_10810 [Thermoleophilaceae bacterium]|nr:hypothetical protein [Thermoleophilaceae bacterium]
MDTSTARNIAHSIHGDQRDRTGGLMVEHLERVAAAVPPEARPVAFLHDVLEHSDTQASELEREGLTPVELAALNLLTREPDESFEIHALRIAYAKGPEGALARVVKVADIDDHLVHHGQPMPPRAYGWARRHVVRCHDSLDAPVPQTV